MQAPLSASIALARLRSYFGTRIPPALMTIIAEALTHRVDSACPASYVKRSTTILAGVGEHDVDHFQQSCALHHVKTPIVHTLLPASSATDWRHRYR